MCCLLNDSLSDAERLFLNGVINDIDLDRLANATNCICSNWFYKCTSNSVYCSYRWIYCWCGNDQGISKIRAVKKRVEIFSVAVRGKELGSIILS